MMFYRGKRARRRCTRPVLLLLSLVLMLAIGAGGTLAYLVTSSGPVTNTFTPGEVTIDVDEPDWNGTVKQNVTIQNTSDVEVYVRATIVANWVDANGNIIAPAVKGTDYTDFTPAEGWVLRDGYYYWTSPVAVNGHTGELINECKPIASAKPEGADHLQMTILSQAIQAEPEQAIKEAWGVTISEGAVTPVSGT